METKLLYQPLDKVEADALVCVLYEGDPAPAELKFAGAWLACLFVMARGNIFAAFGMDHVILATVCGTVGGCAFGDLKYSAIFCWKSS